MLYLIGLGLADEKDITVKGLEIVKKAERVYLEAYTAILLVDKEQLEAFYGRPIIIADREMVESASDDILADADKVDVAFLVVGDPYGATTHTDLVLRARTLHIPTQTIHNASILNAIGATGLQLYNFGQTVSVPFFTDAWRPTSFAAKVGENFRLGLHTLLLLDIKVKEPSLAALARGRVVYEPPRFMTVGQCCGQLVEVVEGRRGDRAGVEEEEEEEAGEGREERKEGGGGGGGEEEQEEEKEADSTANPVSYTPTSLAIGVARIGAADQRIVVGTLRQLCDPAVDELLGRPLHSVVLLGWRMHDLEREFLREWALDAAVFDEVWERDYEGRQ